MTGVDGLLAGSGALAWARWGRNRQSAATKARIFDTTLSAKGTGADGYPNPDSPQAAKTASINAKEKKARPEQPHHRRQHQERQHGGLDEEQRCEEHDPVQGRIRGNRGVGPGPMALL
jgi:hypothetical protein